MAPDLNPDPAQGVFETFLALDGGAIELDAHLGRLGGSLVALYGQQLPQRAGEEVAERAAALSLGRVRLTVVPGGPGVVWEVDAAEIDRSVHFPAHEHGVDLTPLAFPGGLGPHKWADRSTLPAAGDRAVSLLLDQEEVLESARANLFAIIDGVLATPPADGRILAGITRAATIELARAERIEVAERPLRLEEALAAEAVFLTNSIRGIEPARSLAGEPLEKGHVLVDRLAAGLRARWAAERRPVPTHPA